MASGDSRTHDTPGTAIGDRPPVPDEAAPGPADGAPEPTGSRFAVRDAMLHGVLAGLCPLIPIPLLDDWALAYVRRRMVAQTCQRHGYAPAEPEVEHLTGEAAGGSTARRMLMLPVDLVRSLALRPIKKVLRKVFFFLSIKQSVDVASRVFHEAYLVDFAWREGFLTTTGGTLGSARAQTIRGAVETALKKIDPRPVDQALSRTFAGSRILLSDAVSGLSRLFQRGASLESASRAAPSEQEQVLREEEERLGGLLDRLTAAVWHEKGYFGALEEQFRAAATAAENESGG